MIDVITFLKILSIFLHIVCFGVVGTKIIGDRDVGRLALIIAIALSLFFIEHFVGLGTPSFIWPATTLGCIALLAREKIILRRQLLQPEFSFLAGFTIGLAWRLTFPDITGTTEALTDLYFLSNYLPGYTLPAPDVWYAGEVFNIYYGFMHYSAALVGRFFELPPGVCYNLAWCIYLGLLVSIISAIARRFALALPARIFLVAIVLGGGNGVTPFVPLMLDHDNPETAANERYGLHAAKTNLVASIRWLGGMERNANTRFAAAFRGAEIPPNASASDIRAAIAEASKPTTLLLASTLSFYTYAGDLHPALSGILFALIALYIILLIEQESQASRQKILHGLLAATGPLVLVSNAWAAPMHTLLIFAWLLQRILSRQPVYWLSFFYGGTLSLGLVMPFLFTFVDQPSAITIKPVSQKDENPLRTILYFWPIIGVFAIGIFYRIRLSITLLVSLVCLLVFLFSSFFYLEDQLGPYYKRFNTTLKMWEWLLSIGTVFGFAAALAVPAKLAKSAAILIGCLLLVFSVELAIYTAASDKSTALHLSGHRWFTSNAGDQSILNELSELPYGRVLERNLGPLYTPTSRFALFSGKPIVLGWPGHIMAWRNHPESLPLLLEQTERFYQGQMTPEETEVWLQKMEVDYIVWSSEELGLDKRLHSEIDASLSKSFRWHATEANPGVGLWIRATPDA